MNKEYEQWATVQQPQTGKNSKRVPKNMPSGKNEDSRLTVDFNQNL
jgi:hypothetical protein